MIVRLSGHYNYKYFPFSTQDFDLTNDEQVEGPTLTNRNQLLTDEIDK